MAFPGTAPDATDSHPESDRIITDFTSITPDLGWYVVNDNVMGGRSEGDFEVIRGELSFTGRTNTNGGGFSSIRTNPVQLDLSNHDGIQLRVKGDGRRYTWRLTTDARWRGRPVSYWAEFDTRDSEWSTVSIPFSGFIPKYRGFRLEGPALDRGQITGMGLMIYDKQDGPFEFQLGSVHAYSAKAPFSLLQYQWKKRVLVVSAPSDDDEDLIKQQNELALTSEEFSDRDMAIVTLLNNAVSTAEERELTSEETAAARAALSIRSGSFALRLIGKDGSVKLAGETATSMSEIYSLIDTMPMRQREKNDRQYR